MGDSRRELVRYLAGASLARVATEGVAIALVLVIRDAKQGAGLEGAFVAAWSAPSLLSGVVVGHGLDRTRHPRRLLAAAGLIAASALVGDAVLVGHAPSDPLLALTALGGVTVPLFTGGLSSLLPGLLDTDRLRSAQALDSATYSVSGIAGPAAVALVAAVAPRLALLAPAAAIALGASAIPVAIVSPAHRTHARRPSAVAAVRALAATPSLLATTTASTVAAFGWGGLEIGAAAIAATFGSARLAGLDLAAIAVTALAVALILARHPIQHPERAAASALGVMTGGAVLIAAGHTALVALAGFAIFGAGDGALLPAVLAIRSRDAPTEMTSAVFTTAASIKTAATALGAAIAGAAAGALGGHGLFLALALTQLGAAATAAVVARRTSHTSPPR